MAQRQTGQAAQKPLEDGGLTEAEEKDLEASAKTSERQERGQARMNEIDGAKSGNGVPSEKPPEEDSLSLVKFEGNNLNRCKRPV